MPRECPTPEDFVIQIAGVIRREKAEKNNQTTKTSNELSLKFLRSLWFVLLPAAE